MIPTVAPSSQACLTVLNTHVASFPDPPTNECLASFLRPQAWGEPRVRGQAATHNPRGREQAALWVVGLSSHQRNPPTPVSYGPPCYEVLTTGWVVFGGGWWLLRAATSSGLSQELLLSSSSSMGRSLPVSRLLSSSMFTTMLLEGFGAPGTGGKAVRPEPHPLMQLHLSPSVEPHPPMRIHPPPSVEPHPPK